MRTDVSRPFKGVEVTVQECDGSFDKMLRRFVRRTKEDGILTEVRLRRSFVKPSQRRRAVKRV